MDSRRADKAVVESTSDVIRLGDVRSARLVEAARLGDQDSFGELYRMHVRSVARFVTRSLGRTQEAEDVVQETFEHAWRSLPRFRGDSAFSTWLLGIARNRTRKRWEKRPEVSQSRTSDAPVALWPQLLARERLRLLNDALAELTPDARDVADLVLVQGRSYAACSEELEMPLNTVASHVSRARKHLMRYVIRADSAAPGGQDE